MSRSPGAVLIRADAGVRTGTGHVMRCLALAQAWQDAGGRVIFFSCDLPDALAKRLQLEGCELRSGEVQPGSPDDAERTLQLATETNAVVIVVDGYQFADEYFRRLRIGDHRVAAIDDFGCSGSDGPIVNQNLYAGMTDYPGCDERTLLMAGSRFALLRREFSKLRQQAICPRKSPKHLLITCGGSDPTGAVDRILTKLAGVSDCFSRVTVVMGGVSERLQQVQTLAATLPFPIEVIHNCQNMAELMADCDLAISAAGTTCWELVCCGVPVIAVITADNQVRVAESLEAAGPGWNSGWMHEGAADKAALTVRQIHDGHPGLAEVSARCLDGIDGQGAERVCQLLAGPVVTLRLAELQDSRTLWLWRNDEAVRRVSFSAEPIPWEDHERWFAGRLAGDTSEILIGENTAGESVGQVRLDFAEDGAVISIVIAPEFRGAGFGTALIRTATTYAFVQKRLRYVNALICSNNEASQAAFVKAGYRLQGSAEAGSEGMKFRAENSVRPAGL